MPVKQKSNLAMFLIPSAVGILIFMIPVKFQGTWTILVKILADFISSAAAWGPSFPCCAWPSSPSPP